MTIEVSGPGGSGGISIDDITTLQSEIDAVADSIPQGGLRGANDIQWTGAASQGGSLPSNARLVPVGDGNERWIARSVEKDDTKFANWTAQAVAVQYFTPFFTSAASLPAGTNGTAGYTTTLVAAGDLGGGDVKYALGSGATDATHIAGLTLNQATGVLSGTPNMAGDFIVTVIATDELNGVGTLICTLHIAVAATPSLVLPPVPSIQPAINVAFSFDPRPFLQNLSAGTGIVWSSPSTPNHHLIINASTGIISGTPLTADGGHSFNITVQVTNGTTTLISNIQMTIPGPGLAITSGSLPVLQQSQAIASTTLTSTGGVGTVTWTSSGLPAGLALSSSGVLTGTPTGSGAYDAFITATDSTTPTPVAVTVEYTGTVAVAATPFSWFGGAADYNLTTDAGTPKVGDSIDLDLVARYAANAGGPVIVDSGASPSTPADGLDVNKIAAGHYGGTPSADTTVNPILRASNDGGVTWKSTQCHLTILKSVAGIDVSNFLGQMVLGDNTSVANGLQNMSTLAKAIATAKAGSGGKEYRLFSSQGTDDIGGRIYIGLHRSAFSSSAYISSGSSSTAGLSWWDLGNVQFYLLGGTGKQQPTNSLECIGVQIYNVDNLRVSINIDIRGGSQATPPGVGTGDPGFYSNGILLIGCSNEQGHCESYNNVGVTGNSSGGTNETFDFKLGKSRGGADLDILIAGKAFGDTGTSFASGVVNQQTPETAGAHAPLAKFKIIASWRRHVFGEFAGGPSQIMHDSAASDCPRGFYAEDGAPVAGAIRSPLLIIGESGMPSSPVTTLRCGSSAKNTGAIGTAASGGGLVGALDVQAHTSTNDNFGPYVTQGTTGPSSFTIAHSTIIGAPGSCLVGQGGGGATGPQNIGKVAVDTATCTVAGLGANPQNSPNVANASGAWTKLS